ncbi:putative cell division protein FtsQ [Waddlia chondrophila 2032/99]|uniref:Putative cell division protein FtsQ n=2 Tax=Waddlia chondrophila TaxID=71667 RepID=D6YRP0_WADCW|nr:FtsQ-type POTRA domain-containing protein [Waddlia chondrophila]ADI38735.1 putative cell division protein FtsQ [Waddlia chondrophila WSU 86-1044]CCB91068.1 putative cell division protein FtsQ [Waddlia chondrophila 2032/99]
MKQPFKRALATVALITLFVSGGSGLAMLYFMHIKESQRADPAFSLRYLDQKGELPSHYVEEILGLSSDKPINIYEFNALDEKRKLLSHPLIKSAEVKKQIPDTCQVVYELHEPIALLSDWENAAIDRDGRLIPFHPFYQMEGLPSIIIGEIENPKWGNKLRLPRVHLAIRILKSIPLQDLEALDVSRVDLPSFGQKEIVMTLNDSILRLNPDNWKKGWRYFLEIQPLLNPGGKTVVDLRIPKIALVHFDIDSKKEF